MSNNPTNPISIQLMIVAAVFSLLIGQFFGGHVVEIFMTSLTPHMAPDFIGCVFIRHLSTFAFEKRELYVAEANMDVGGIR